MAELTSSQSLQELAAMHQEVLGVKGFLFAYEQAANSGGFLSGANGIVLRPWIDEPEGSVPFDEQGGITLPAIGPGFSTVLSFQVPLGYDGVIKYLSNNFLGGGFVDFSGDIVWQILADNRPIRNFSNIRANKGTTGIPRPVSPIRIYSGQVISYVVNHFANIGLAGQVVVSLTGYLYPSGKMS
jgi:hypothetical protein